MQGGWKFIPAAFFLLLNFAVCQVRGLFAARLALLLFLLAVFALCRRLRLERILAPIAGGVALILFTYGVAQKFLLFPLILEGLEKGTSFYSQALRARVASGRVFAIFPLPTLYAMICGLLLIFIVHYFYHSRGKGRIFWGALFLLGAFNLVLTESFGGILIFTAAILYYLFAAKVFRARHLAPLLMVLALVFFLVTALRFSEARELEPLRLRLANWEQAVRVISGAPLLGVGLGNYETAVSERVLPGEPASIYAHNFPLQAAAETGLPLFALLLAAALAWLWQNRSRLLRPESALFAAAFLLILLFNLFDVGSFFFAAGICLAIVLSQLAPNAGPVRPRHWLLVAMTAAPLLLHAAAASRQQSGDLWLSRGEPLLAERSYRAALKIEPFSYRAWLGLAHIAWQRDDVPASDSAVAKVLSLYPSQPFANYLLSFSSWRRGAYLTSLAGAERAARGNKPNREYQRWHERLQAHFAQPPPLPGS